MKLKNLVKKAFQKDGLKLFNSQNIFRYPTYRQSDQVVSKDNQGVEYDQRYYEFPKEYKPYVAEMEHQTMPYLLAGVALTFLLLFIYKKENQFYTGRSKKEYREYVMYQLIIVFINMAEQSEKKIDSEQEQIEKEQTEEELEIQKQITLPFNQEELKKQNIQKEGLQKQFQENFLQEKEIHESNQKKVLMEWRVFISQIKCEEIKRELNILCNQLQRTWELQNGYLKGLDQRLQDATKQYDLTVKNHQLHVDKFIQLRNIKMNSLQKNFTGNLEIVKEEFEQENSQIIKDRNEQIQRLNNTIQNIKEEEQIKSNIVKENFQQLKEEIRDLTTEEMELMQNEMNTKKVNIYNDLNHLFEKFMKHSKEKFKKYTNLMEMNAQDSKQIEETIKKITKTKNKIKLTSLKIIQMKKEFESKNFKIKKENDEIARNFLALKNKMFDFRDKERKKLTELVTNTKETTLKLNKIYQLGESILKNTQLCRKLEFENEKILPFVQSDQQQEFLYKEFQENSDLQNLKKFAKFQNILKRYNKVLLDTFAFEKQNKTLKQKNKNLKNQLLKMMDGVTITKYVLENQDNNLMKTTKKPIYRESLKKENRPYEDGNKEILKVKIYNQVNYH